jgi:hypothetical protein
MDHRAEFNQQPWYADLMPDPAPPVKPPLTQTPVTPPVVRVRGGSGLSTRTGMYVAPEPALVDPDKLSNDEIKLRYNAAMKQIDEGE